MQRVIVGGISGAGKTTMARALAGRLDLPYVDLDALFHGPGWTPRPSFVADVDAVLATDRWVVDSDGYAVHLGHRLHERADTLIWLDYSRPVVMRRVVVRTARRVVTRERLFNGNRERLRAAVLDPEHPVRWAWRQHGPRRARTEALVADPRMAGLTVVRLRTPAQAERWLAAVPPAG